MNSNIILDKNKGLILSVSNKKSRASIKLHNGNVEFKVESLDKKQSSIFRVLDDEIVFSAEYINIEADNFVNNFTSYFNINCKDNIMNVSDNFFLNSHQVDFKIYSIANINANKILFC